MNIDSEIPKINNPEFLKLLISNGTLTEKDAGNLQKKFHGNTLAILVYLVKGNVSKKEELCKLWGDSIGLAYVDLEKTLFEHDVVPLIPEKLAKKNNMIPLYKLGDALTIAASDPKNQSTLKTAELAAKCPISLVFSLPDEIKDAIEIEYQTTNSLDEFINKLALSAFDSRSKITAEQLEKLAGDQAVIELTRGLLLLAVKEKASDIHIEPGENFARIRFRIDGVLQERLKLDTPLLNPLVSRLKILAQKDITEKRKTQDGRFSLELPNKSIDFRFSSVPIIYGEKIVLRILGGSQLKDVPDISELFLSKKNHDDLKTLIENPNGVFFVTGPTGSGKTTTLYSAIKHLNKPRINIMTIEDPVEYRLEGINQIQVNTQINLDFATVLRSLLRQDPDVILVGEIRDAETAKIASQAALTGHLVFATMHTNNALQSITRLIEIGVEPFLVAPAIIGVMAQRLVRRLCDHCKEKYRLSPEEIEKYFISDGSPEVYFYRDRGCSYCNDTGFSGRIAIHELFMMNDEVRTLVAKNASIIEIEKCIQNTNFHDMRYDGMKKVLRGLTTIGEVDRVSIDR